MTDPGNQPSKDQSSHDQPSHDQSSMDQPSYDEPGDDGAEPDPRFTFANERTFLAWSRTALALVVAGLGVVQLLPPFPGVPWGRQTLGIPLIVFGAIVAITAYIEWTQSQRAMRQGRPLPRSVMPVIMTVVIAAMAVLAAIVVLASALR